MIELEIQNSTQISIQYLRFYTMQFRLESNLKIKIRISLSSIMMLNFISEFMTFSKLNQHMQNNTKQKLSSVQTYSHPTNIPISLETTISPLKKILTIFTWTQRNTSIIPKDKQLNLYLLTLETLDLNRNIQTHYQQLQKILLKLILKNLCNS